MAQALDGIRVIDMTHNQAGPACGQILAWLGAEVIKLETPGKGDVARTQNNDELFFLSFNANKKSLTLNLKSGRLLTASLPSAVLLGALLGAFAVSGLALGSLLLAARGFIAALAAARFCSALANDVSDDHVVVVSFC